MKSTYGIMSCPSIGPKLFWTIILDHPNRFGRVQIILDGSKSFWTCPNICNKSNLELSKMNWIVQNLGPKEGQYINYLNIPHKIRDGVIWIRFSKDLSMKYECTFLFKTELQWCNGDRFFLDLISQVFLLRQLWIVNYCVKS